MSHVTNAIYIIISERMDFPFYSITPQIRFIEDLGADSMDMTEFAVELENEFNIEIDTTEFSVMETVAGVIELVNKKLSEQKSTK